MLVMDCVPRPACFAARIGTVGLQQILWQTRSTSRWRTPRLDGQAAHRTAPRMRRYDERDVLIVASDGGRGRCGCAGAKRFLRQESEHRGATGADARSIVSALWVSQVRHTNVVGLDNAASQDHGQGEEQQGLDI